MENYDLITNVLDLVGFTMVTPELARFTRLPFGWLLWVITMFVGTAAIMVFVAMIAKRLVFARRARQRTSCDNNNCPTRVVSFYSVYLLDYPVSRRRTFRAGLGLLFISRVIAVYTSALKAGW